jgi:(1->4)-alpha-D-glucan 1-alpha-D-glucosylmutase
MKLRAGTTASSSRRRRELVPEEDRRLRIPGATYRLQFTREFTLRDALGLLDYLQALGITDVYASPLFEARPESSHGYDVCSHDGISEDLGGNKAFEELRREMRRRGMGLLLDIVPNHMAAHERNPWWWDVLKHGQASRYAKFFDIHWERGGGKLVLPVLGEDLDKVIAAGQLTVASEGNEQVLRYYDKRFPISPGTDNEPSPMSRRVTSLLAAQHYKLVHWRRGAHEINYRRFFDVGELVSLRVEDGDVFAETHRLVLELLRRGEVQGVRVDHPDGLRDPKQYFDRLQAALHDADARPYVVAEKILSSGERLPQDWAVAGTTGYEFLKDVNSLFVAHENSGAVTDFFREFTGCNDEFSTVAYRAKKRVLAKSFAAEVDAIAERLARVTDREGASLRGALVEIIACFPVYRTYLREESREVPGPDAQVIENACRAARSAAPSLSSEIDMIEQVLSLDPRYDRRSSIQFIQRFQQLTGPAIAKGIEDTAFYRFNRLVSLNEVGGDPGQFGITVDEFHSRNAERAKHWPHTLLATATHDTKRGEDLRARINVLSEMPEEWRAAVMGWRDLNAKHKTLANGIPAPDANDEYLLYQTLMGAWDGERAALRERMVAYMLKAIREAKRRTSWLDPNEAYERATKEFVERVLEDETFLEAFLPFQRKVAFFGRSNSLAQTLLKLTSPGVPDIYQGSESWDFNLVDPDNRRPVDFELRRRWLAAERFAEESSKLFVVSRTLRFRNAHRELFDDGSYRPVMADTQHVCGFVREFEAQHCLVVVPRLVCALVRGEERAPVGAVWKDDSLRLDASAVTSAYRNVFTGERVRNVDGVLRLREVFATFPVALLEPE